MNTHHTIARLTAITVLWSMTLVLLGMAGCNDRLRVTASPSDSLITMLRQSDGRQHTGSSPLEVPIQFRGEADRYTLRIEPSPIHQDRHIEHEQIITESTFGGLPLDPGRTNVRVLSVTLPRREYVVIDYVYVFIDHQGRLRTVLLPSRSYREITEIDGAAPALVMDLGVNLGIEGLAISPDGSRIIYSEAVIREQPRQLEMLRDEAGLREVDLVRANLRGIRVAGGGIERITSEDFKDRFPSFTHDGEHIIFS